MKFTTSIAATPLPLFLLLGVLWFGHLGYRDLSDPDEGRYATIPYEMWVSGDWLTPRLNGFKYFEKPPLQYWGTAVFYQAFGAGNTTSRLWCASMGFLGILWTTWLGRRLFGATAGYFAGLVLGSSLLYVAMGHMNTLDMGLSFFLALGMGALLLAQEHRTNPQSVRGWMLLAWTALAGAVLSKGMIGLFLPAASVVLYSLWQRDFALWRHLHIGKGVLLFLLLVAPWFIAVTLRNPEFPEFFFIREHLARYTTAVHQRTGHILYFIPVFLAGSLPWLTQAVGALCKPSFPWRPVARTFDAQRLLWVYIVFTLVFFSFSNSKLIPYILPAFPALALLVGQRLARTANLTRDLWIMAVVTLCLAGIGASMVAFLSDEYHPPEWLAGYRLWVFAAVTVLAVSLAAVYALLGRFGTEGSQGERGRKPAVLLLAVGVIVAFQLLGWGYQTINSVHSARQLATAIATHQASQSQSAETNRSHTQDAPVYCVHCFYHSLPFYLHSTVRLVGYKGELEMGIQQEPDQWLADFPLFLASWQQQPQAVAILRRRDLAMWQEQGGPMHTIYEDPVRIAVVHP